MDDNAKLTDHEEAIWQDLTRSLGHDAHKPHRKVLWYIATVVSAMALITGVVWPVIGGVGFLGVTCCLTHFAQTRSWSLPADFYERIGGSRR